MANNFHDVGGMLIVGVDLHEALLLPGIPPAVFVPIPMPRMPHINFLHPFTMGGNQKSTVQFNGRNTVVHWHSPEKLWPHLNLPPFPIDILIPIDILFGAQIAWLPRGSVLIEGEPSTCANIYGPMSINLDCWDIANIPSSMIIQPSTVQTSPSLGDYLDGLKAVAIDFAISVIMNAVADAGGALLAKGAKRARSAARRAFGREAADAAQGAAAREVGDVAQHEAADQADHVQGQLFDDVPYVSTQADARAAGFRRPDGSTWWPPDGGFAPGHAPGSLAPGSQFDRYGGSYDAHGNFHDYGTNVSPLDPNGNPYDFDSRSLPDGFDDKPFSTYRVTDHPANANGLPGESGSVAPWFDRPGGAAQHTFPPTPRDEWIPGPGGQGLVDPNSIDGLIAQGRIELVSRPGAPPVTTDPQLF